MVDNNGRIIADAGAIALQADVVNQNGLLQANSVRNQNGVIDLVASESVALGATSVISAAGDAGVSAGGTVSIKSANAFSDQPGSFINVSGGEGGGNGGEVSLCAENMGGIASKIQALASPGWTGGGLFIDPTSITIGNSGKGTVGADGSSATKAARARCNSTSTPLSSGARKLISRPHRTLPWPWAPFGTWTPARASAVPVAS